MHKSLVLERWPEAVAEKVRSGPYPEDQYFVIWSCPPLKINDSRPSRVLLGLGATEHSAWKYAAHTMQWS